MKTIRSLIVSVIFLFIGAYAAWRLSTSQNIDTQTTILQTTENEVELEETVDEIDENPSLEDTIIDDEVSSVVEEIEAEKSERVRSLYSKDYTLTTLSTYD